MTDTMEKTTTRKVNRAVLALGHLTANDESRPALNYVHIDGSTASAADGFVAGWATLPDTDPADHEGGETNVHRDTALKALRKASAKEPGLTLETRAGKHLLTADRNQSEPIAGPEPKPDSFTFPDVQGVTPKGAPQARTVLNLPILKQLVAYFDAGMAMDGRDQHAPIELRVHGPQSATEWRAVSSDGSNMTALAMPMVSGAADDWFHEPVEGVKPSEVTAHTAARELQYAGWGSTALDRAVHALDDKGRAEVREGVMALLKMLDAAEAMGTFGDDAAETEMELGRDELMGHGKGMDG